jgi:hypothetical protein
LKLKDERQKDKRRRRHKEKQTDKPKGNRERKEGFIDRRVPLFYLCVTSRII